MESPPPLAGKFFRSAVAEQDWPRAIDVIAGSAERLVETCLVDGTVEAALLAFTAQAPECHQIELAAALSWQANPVRMRNRILRELIDGHLSRANAALERHYFHAVRREWEKMMRIPAAGRDLRRIQACARKTLRYVADIENASVCAAFVEQDNPSVPSPPESDLALLGPMYHGLHTIAAEMINAAATSGLHDRLAVDIALAALRHCGWPTWRSMASIMHSNPEVLLTAGPLVRRCLRPGGASRHYDWLITGRQFSVSPPAQNDDEYDPIF